MPNDTQPLDPTVLTHAGPVEIIAPGVTEQWLYDDCIFVCTINSIKREAIDAFVERIMRFNEEWPLDKPSYLLTDYRGSAFTPYNVKRTRELVASSPRDKLGYSATLIPGGVVGHLMKNFNDTVTVRHFNKLKQCVFFEYDKALAWLVTQMEKET